MAQVIDLRKPGNEKGPNSSSAARKPAAPLEWKALEFEAREKGPYWFIGTGAIATGLIIFGIFAKSYFFIAFTALAYVTLVLSAKRPPRELAFSVRPEGVSAGRKFYGYKELKSFWILDTPEGKMLSLETGQTLSPYVRLPLGGANPEEIRGRLLKVLPEKEHQEFLTDHIARGLGL